MKIFSKTHAFTVPVSSLAVAPKGADGKPLPKTNLVAAPAGTLFDMPDDVAKGYVAEGLATEYDEQLHGPAKEGTLAVDAFQRVTPMEVLPEGHTRPSVVRQDETLNDGRSAAPLGALKVVGDTKENADAAAARDAADKALTEKALADTARSNSAK